MDWILNYKTCIKNCVLNDGASSHMKAKSRVTETSCVWLSGRSDERISRLYHTFCILHRQTARAAAEEAILKWGGRSSPGSENRVQCAISYWHDTVVCPSVRLSVCDEVYCG